MKKMLLMLAFVPALLFSQSRKQRKALEAERKADQQIINDLKNYSQYLLTKNTASDSKDSFEVPAYISSQFKIMGLQPKGTEGYFQPFFINEGKQVKSNTFLKVNGSLLAINKDYIPLSYSAQKTVTGMPAMSLKEKGVPWFTDVKDWLEDNTSNPLFNLNAIIKKEAARAASKGATALFLYNSGNINDHLQPDPADKTAPLAVPVVYITAEGFRKYFNDPSQILDIELNIAFKEIIKKVKNTVGFIDNGAPSTVVVAMPYNIDFPADKELLPEVNKAIINTNNAIDPAIFIELARMLAASKAKNNNYAFVAYPKEDKGTKSNRWLDSIAKNLSANYIIHLCHVARYNDNKKLLIALQGTAAGIAETIKPIANKNIEVSFLSGNKDSSQYFTNIPVLNFYTDKGDYNNTTASADKINYEGEMHIVRFIQRFIEAINTMGKLAFAQSN